MAAAESANPDTAAEIATTDSGSGSDPSSRRGRLLLLLGKKALIAKAPLLIAKGIGAKKGFAGASIIKSGAVAGASGLAKVSGLAGVTGAGLTGLTGLTGIRGITGSRLVSSGFGNKGRVVVARPVVIKVPFKGDYASDYGYKKYYDTDKYYDSDKYYGQEQYYDPKPEYYYGGSDDSY